MSLIPFITCKEQRIWMVFEIKNRSTRRGEVGLAVGDGESWNYQGSVLRESYHLSYPYVFECDGEYFMVPESLEPGAIRLYRSDPFPSRWVHEADLVRGQFADPSLFHFEGRWWMFACSEPFRHNVLRLFHADRLDGPWSASTPLSPIVTGDASRARPAGRIVTPDDRLIRFAQDCTPAYGVSGEPSVRDHTDIEARLSGGRMPVRARSWPVRARVGTATACTTSTRTGPRKAIGSPPSTAGGTGRPWRASEAVMVTLRINVFARDLGWLFEDLKRHF